ncbi:hypothetical protein ILUMI_22509 [Ignelater luminosus]|uniref:Uncharacterized protein n=1 Tax=Ignelater luminosus TaxID=2038154 RepID=A0A8K0CE73_IGNLU|nr:hypothetical protein ILUMI_22509 [Ignelater luminosus]
MEQIRDQINTTLARYLSLPLIEVVRLGQCELSHFSVQSLRFVPQLKEIEIFNSIITELSYVEYADLFGSTADFDVATNGCSIRKLNLQRSDVRMIERNSFDNVSSLQHLDLSNNRIDNISASTFSIPSLETLDFSFCLIKLIESEAFIGATNLHELNLRVNNLETVENNTFSGTSLQLLDLSESYKLVTIEPNAFEGLSNLTKLKLYRNRILRLDPKVLEGLKLRELYIGFLPNSTIEEGIYDKFNDLEVLQLAGSSSMSKIPAFPASVRELNLFNNRITSIEAADFKILNKTNSSSNTPSRLEVLNLDSNQIATIEAYAFANLSSLRVLDINSNKISKIDEHSFAQSTVEELHVRWNGITSIDPGSFRGRNIFTSPTLKVLYLERSISKLSAADFEDISHVHQLYVEPY